jgi:hypothetical protein
MSGYESSTTPAYMMQLTCNAQSELTALEEQELADWRAGRNAIYQLAALPIGARLAVADA